MNTHPPMAAPMLLTLEQIDGPALPLVGGKAYRLARLKQHGFNVPSGLVLTAAFFEAHIRHCRLAGGEHHLLEG